MTTTTLTKGRLALFHLRRHRHHVVVNPRQIADVLHVYATQAKLHHCFGKDEVMRLCEQFSMDYSRMEQWYDGYLLGQERVHVYNPNSVACAIEERQFHSYWTETETYEALQVYIDMDFDGLQQELVAMLDGQHVFANLSGFKNAMTGIASKDDACALLAHLGYLGYDEVEAKVFIPNEEIRRGFATSIREGARPQLARLMRESSELQRRVLAGDEDYVADAVRRAHNSACRPCRRVRAGGRDL